MINDDSKLVSIIMPAYNAEKTIEKTIDSVIEQIYVNWELIIVDDGSSDNTKQIVNSIVDNRIIYLYQENTGPAQARNLGIEHAKGEYICFLDSDDLLHKEYLYLLVNSADCHNADVAMCDYIKIADTSSLSYATHGNELFGEQELSSDECIIEMFYKKRVMPYPYLKLFRKDIIGETRFPKHLRLGEDLAFNYEIFLRINKSIYIDQILYFHVENPYSITHTLNEETAKNHFYDLQNKLSECEGKYKNAIICRMFVVAYDFLCQMKENNCFAKQLFSFIKKYRRTVLNDYQSSLKVRMIATSSIVSIPFTIKICRVFKKRNMEKAI